MPLNDTTWFILPLEFHRLEQLQWVTLADLDMFKQWDYVLFKRLDLFELLGLHSEKLFQKNDWFFFFQSENPVAVDVAFANESHRDWYKRSEVDIGQNVGKWCFWCLNAWISGVIAVLFWKLRLTTFIAWWLLSFAFLFRLLRRFLGLEFRHNSRVNDLGDSVDHKVTSVGWKQNEVFKKDRKDVAYQWILVVKFLVKKLH